MELPDAIMQPNTLINLRTFLKLGGHPADAIKLLSGSYQGYAQMCNLLASWLKVSGESDQQISELVEDHIKNLVLQRFDPKKADYIIQQAQDPPSWLPKMIETPKWRQLIYTLSKEHKDCELLNFTIQLISDAGHQTEIASLTSASIYFSVFNRVFSGFLERVIKVEDETELAALLPDFKQMCNHSQHTYAYAQAMIGLLSKEKNGENLVRLSQELTQSVKEHALAEKFDLYLSNYSSYPQELIEAVVSILRRKSAGQGDVLKLYNVYSSQNPPPVKFLCRPDLLALLVGTIFQPGETIPIQYRNAYFYVLAYASCKKPQNNILSREEKDELDEIISALTEVYMTYQQFYVGRELEGVVTRLLDFIKYPVIAMGTLHWCSIPLSDAGWYLTNYNTQSIQILLDLLKEIGYMHVFQRVQVLTLLKKSFELDTELDPLASLDVKKKVLDAIIYLMECGYVMPVLSTVDEWSLQGIDQSLIRYYVTKVLEMVGPPYSVVFVQRLLKIISRLSERSMSVPEYKQVLKPFLEQLAEIKLTKQEQDLVEALKGELNK
uniref:Uncharacterized protein n=1 Tax=Arcella intermedia TaxID=1963864 RepID=A0A6B2L0X1_9EUKA